MDKELKPGTDPKGTDSMSSQEYILTVNGEVRYQGTRSQCKAQLLLLQDAPVIIDYTDWAISPVNPISRLIDVPKEIPLYLE